MNYVDPSRVFSCVCVCVFCELCVFLVLMQLSRISIT